MKQEIIDIEELAQDSHNFNKGNEQGQQLMERSFKETTDYLVTEGCVTDEQRKEFFAMIDRNVERSKYNWAEHELADQVDFFCEKVTLLADACGVTKHKED